MQILPNDYNSAVSWKVVIGIPTSYTTRGNLTVHDFTVAVSVGDPNAPVFGRKREVMMKEWLEEMWEKKCLELRLGAPFIVASPPIARSVIWRAASCWVDYLRTALCKSALSCLVVLSIDVFMAAFPLRQTGNFRIPCLPLGSR